MGSGAHVREGTILEEYASGAHCVGLKQTILFPYVTVGSLINFCDCLMAGGTSRKNHGEVGSSYIHFNFTPNQDKATASLIGDVPRGVMLDQAPVFLGGQGGLVGPCRLAFGTVIAAGSIYRKDVTEPGRMVFEGSPRGGSVPFVVGQYRAVKRIVVNNIHFIANLMALSQWYRWVRVLFIGERFGEMLWKGLLANVDLAIKERIHRLGELAAKMPAAIETAAASQTADASDLLRQKKVLHERWQEVAVWLDRQSGQSPDSQDRSLFLEQLEKLIPRTGNAYLETIAALEPRDRQIGTRWLQGIVDDVVNGVARIWPDFFQAVGATDADRDG
jgi:UDP-N-acetylglucosamine/UDP-N-acetylgalactosamine diphosphorylase